MDPTALTLALGLFGVTVVPATAQDDSFLQARAEKAIAEATATMGGSLMKALAEGGVGKAVPFCHEEVKQLGTRLQEEHGVGIQRVTHKPRNPANQADEAESALIGSIQRALAAGESPSPVVKERVDGTRVYYAPILIPAPTCLKCHGQPGSDILPADQELIRSLYPEDEATGFKVGDLRGLWKITIEPPNRKQP